MPVLSIIDGIVKELEQNINSVRIKKLIFYACKDRWENDISILAGYQLKDLIQELKESKPTIEQLKSELDSLVKTLNRQTEYDAIANTIINELTKLYNEPAELTQVVFIRPENTGSAPGCSSIFENIAAQLEQDANSLRIKKLIFYVCQGTWENDPDSLARFNLAAFLQKLTQLYPTIDQLTLAINSQVQTLNRYEEYSIVGNIIITKLDQIYNEPLEPTLVKTKKKPENNIVVDSVIPQASKEQPAVEADKQIPAYDPFDLRLEVMKYTNPLRAKILLFSAIYHSSKTTKQDWYLIRSETLDDLLFKVFNTCPTIQELESKLYSTASSIDSTDESTQAASAIVQCLRRFYSKK